jgi:putative membrane protein (TIGR04086 family)
MAGKRRFLWGICFGIVYFAILIIVSAVFLPGGFAGAGRLLWAAAVCAVGGMAGGMTAHGR